MFYKKKKKKRQSMVSGITQSKSPRKKSELLRSYLLLGCDSHLSSIVPHSVDHAAKNSSKVRKKSACSLQTILEPPDYEKKIRAYSITRDGSKTIVNDMTNDHNNKPEDWEMMMLSQLLGHQVKVTRISKSGGKIKENINNNQSQENQSMKTEDRTTKKCNIFRLHAPKTEKSKPSEKSENVARQEHGLISVADNLNLGKVTNNAETETQPEYDKHNGDRNRNHSHELEDLNENKRFFFRSATPQKGTSSERPHIRHGSYGRAKNLDEEQSSNCHSLYRRPKNLYENKEQSSNCYTSLYKSAKSSKENKGQSRNHPGSKRCSNNSQEQNKSSSSNYDTSQVQQKKMKNVLSLNNLIALDEPIYHVNDYAKTPNKHSQELEQMAQKLKIKWKFIPHVQKPEDMYHVSERNLNDTVDKMNKYTERFRDPTVKILNDLKSLQDDFQSVNQALSEANGTCDTGDTESSSITTHPASYIPVYDSNTNYVILQQSPTPSDNKQPTYYKNKSHETNRRPYYKDKSNDTKQPFYCKDKSQHTKKPISYSFGGPKSLKNEQQQRANTVKQKTQEHRRTTDLSMKSNAEKRSQNPGEPFKNAVTTQTTESLQTTWHSQKCYQQLKPNLYSGRENVSDRPERLVPIGTPGVGPVQIIPVVHPNHIVPNQQKPQGAKLPLPTGCYYLSSEGYLYPTYNQHIPPNAMPKPQYIVSPEYYPYPVYVSQPEHCGPQPHLSEESGNNNFPPGHVSPKQSKMDRRCPFKLKPQKTFFIHGISKIDTKQSKSETEHDHHSKKWEDMEHIQTSNESVQGDSEEMKAKSVQVEYVLDNVKQIGQQYYDMSSKTMVPVLRLVQNQLICRFYNLRQYLNKTLQAYVDAYENDISRPLSRQGSTVSFVSSLDLRNMEKTPSRPIPANRNCPPSQCTRRQPCNIGQCSRVPMYQHTSSCYCQSRPSPDRAKDIYPRPNSAKEIYPRPNSAKEIYPRPNSAKEIYLRPNNSAKEIYPRPSSAKEIYPRPSSAKEIYPRPNNSAKEIYPRPNNSSKEIYPSPNIEKTKVNNFPLTYRQ